MNTQTCRGKNPALEWMQSEKNIKVCKKRSIKQYLHSYVFLNVSSTPLGLQDLEMKYLSPSYVCYFTDGTSSKCTSKIIFHLHQFCWLWKRTGALLRSGRIWPSQLLASLACSMQLPNLEEKALKKMLA